MSYSKFNAEAIKKELGLSFSENTDLFSSVSELEYSQFLREALAFNVPLALKISTEKARSELIVSPILLEIKKRLESEISLFSGTDFNVDETKGLKGRCDFLLARSPEQLFIEAPVMVIVEAKNDNILSGLWQCMAEMYAAQLFNEREENEIEIVYGAVTTGSLWKFMRLKGKTIEIDVNEYFIGNVGKILGILYGAIAPEVKK